MVADGEEEAEVAVLEEVERVVAAQAAEVLVENGNHYFIFWA